VSSVSVSVEDAHLPSIGAVARALQEQGRRVEQVLDGVGIITGSVPDDRRMLLERVPGVDAVVDGSLTYQLPVPGADVQ
jgi:hypothetical protein